MLLDYSFCLLLILLSLLSLMGLDIFLTFNLQQPEKCGGCELPWVDSWFISVFHRKRDVNGYNVSSTSPTSPCVHAAAPLRNRGRKS